MGRKPENHMKVKTAMAGGFYSTMDAKDFQQTSGNWGRGMKQVLPHDPPNYPANETSILDFGLPKPRDNCQTIVLKPLSLWYSVMASPANKYRFDVK